MGHGPDLIVAKTAGFCPGAQRIVNRVEELLSLHDNVYANGPILHNDHVNQPLQEKGLHFEPDMDKVPADAFVILRAHGTPLSVKQQLDKRGIAYEDIACPYVVRIQKIVSSMDPEQDIVILTGNQEHPEMQATLTYVSCPYYVVQTPEELKDLLEKNKTIFEKRTVNLVSQTTYRTDLWENCVATINNICTNVKIFATICKATEERQYEAKVLSKRCKRMIVIGARHSSNTIKLFNVCRENCDTVLINSVKELNPEFINGAETIGVSAGASTPPATIKEVLEAMSEVVNKIVEDADDFDFATALEESLESMSSDQKVKGVVVGITPTEIQVDIGRKQTGYISYEEYSYNPNANPAEELKVGDEIDCVIMKTNDVEGTIMLSKRRFDSANAWSELEAAVEEGTTMEGVVTDINKGGVIATTEKGIRVFIPGSLATENRGEPLDGLRGTTVQFKVIEVNRQRRRAVGSVKAVLKEAKKAAQEKFWAEAEEGTVYNGIVKSFTQYGAFVDIGGVDGMIHISELSWKRIKHPSDVLSIGDTVEVYIKSLENNRISLGYKKEEDNPWAILKNTYEVGDVVDAKIVGMTAFGAFANIIPEIDGLIHISQIADKRIEKPQDVLSVGDSVKVKITDIDYDKKRVSLSIRALLEPKEDEEVETGEAFVASSDDIAAAAEVAEAAAEAEATEE
jgi:(E)-4-hydroxy-3-methyl-but-2-enyl pyrophosphate reductase